MQRCRCGTDGATCNACSWQAVFCTLMLLCEEQNRKERRREEGGGDAAAALLLPAAHQHGCGHAETAVRWCCRAELLCAPHSTGIKKKKKEELYFFFVCEKSRPVEEASVQHSLRPSPPPWQTARVRCCSIPSVQQQQTWTDRPYELVCSCACCRFRPGRRGMWCGARTAAGPPTARRTAAVQRRQFFF